MHNFFHSFTDSYGNLLKCSVIRQGGPWLLAAVLATPVRADPPLLESTSPRLTGEVLAEVAKSVLDQIGDRPGQRLRLSCDDTPMVPGAMAGATKPYFAWSCAVAWEQQTPVVTSRIWASSAFDLLGGATDGDTGALKADLLQKLRGFLNLKPDTRAGNPPK